jgi:hypothetical protein
MASAGNSGNNTKKRRGNPQNLIPWKPGESGNPKGRKLGARNRKTVILDAIERIGKAKNIDPAELEDAIQAVGIEKAFRGSFFHYEAISDGLYGKLTDKVDVTSGGKTIADLIAAANGARRSKAKKEVQG